MKENIRLTVAFLVFSVFGSLGWYFRYQKHQDAKVRISAQIAQLELEKRLAEYGTREAAEPTRKFRSGSTHWLLWVILGVTIATLVLTVLQVWPRLTPFR